MGDGKVVDGFSFAVGSDVRREYVGGFESFGEVFADVDGDEIF